MAAGGGAAAVYWNRLKIGETFLFWYDDDTVFHERMALWQVSGSTWMVLTPDGDMYAEDVACGDPAAGPRRVVPLPSDGTLPPGLGAPC